MIPIVFPEANSKYVAKGCGDLPAFTDGKCVVSCWQLSDEERQAITDNGKIWLVVHGQATAAVSISTSCPIETATDWPEEVVD